MPAIVTAEISVEQFPRDLFTVEGFSEKYPALGSPQALRALILNAEDRVNSRAQKIPGNGLAEAGAIVRVGRKVLLSESRYFRWIAEQQKRAPRKAA